MTSILIEKARRQAGITQNELARRAGTSRPTLSAYEHGRKSPTLETADRLLAAAGFELELSPRLHWSKVSGARGQTHHVPDQLFRVPAKDAFASFAAPLHLDWSAPERTVDLSDRQSRIRWYELVLREGTARDIRAHVDGVLLVDAWPDIVLPRVIRTRWQNLIDRAVSRSDD